MFTLLIATDFTDNARNALQTALTVAEHAAPSTLYLVHVLSGSEAGEKATLSNMAESDKLATALLAEVDVVRNGAALPDGVHLHCIVLRGDPATVIANEATAHKCDLVVVGTRGRKGIERFVLGSVAEAITQRAPCSVLTVKSKGTG